MCTRYSSIHAVGILQRLGIQRARPPLRLASFGDQAGRLEHLEVLGHAGQGHLSEERLGELGHGRLAGPQPGENRPTGGVGEGGEGSAEGVLA